MGRIEKRAEAGDGRKRCPWAGSAPHMVAYHDDEWGVPLRDERGLFEFLILEGAQAGLSWATILARRDGYRRALHGFDAERIARYGSRDEERLLADAGIIRNRATVAATIGNSRAYLRVRDEPGSFATHPLTFLPCVPVRCACQSGRGPTPRSLEARRAALHRRFMSVFVAFLQTRFFEKNQSALLAYGGASEGTSETSLLTA